jgi:uncharacterized protein
MLDYLDRTACLDLLARRPFGRLVFTHRALPDVLPVNYRLDGDRLLLRLSSGSTAAKATCDAVVAFEVDDIDEASRTGSSVTVVGHAHEITAPGELARARSLGLEAWAGDERDHFVAITVEKVSGRRLRQPAALQADRHATGS